MAAAIDLDDQARFDTTEIDDEGFNWKLATELVARDLAVAEGVPEDSFGVGSVAAEGACVGGCFWGDAVVVWHNL
jgi:hypothetical protein